jgi:hypothetical protein
MGLLGWLFKRDKPCPEDACCAICQDPVGSPRQDLKTEVWVFLPCGHKFGHRCIRSWFLQAGRQSRCPLCRRDMRMTCGHPFSPLPTPPRPARSRGSRKDAAVVCRPFVEMHYQQETQGLCGFCKTDSAKYDAIVDALHGLLKLGNSYGRGFYPVNEEGFEARLGDVANLKEAEWRRWYKSQGRVLPQPQSESRATLRSSLRTFSSSRKQDRA